MTTVEPGPAAAKPAGDGLAPLRSLRRKVRLALAVEAASRLLAGVLLFGCALAVLDWLVLFPAWVRTVFLLAAAGMLGVWTYRRLFLPLFSPIPLDQLALALEGLPPQVRDLLASSLAYAARGGEGSAALWTGIVAQSHQAAELIRTRRLVRLRPVLRSAAVTALAASITAVLILAASVTLARTAVDRIVRPLSGARWPSAQRIEPLVTIGAIAARGEPFTVEMRLAQGDDPRLRAYAYWRQRGGDGGDTRPDFSIAERAPWSGPWESALMRRDEDGVYRLTLENVRVPLIYYFRCGDDDTSDRPGLLRVADRPAVAGTWAVLEPPDYAWCMESQTDSPQRVFDLLADLSFEALVGSRARIVVATSKRLSRANGAVVELVMPDGRRVHLAVENDPADRRVAELMEGGAARALLDDAGRSEVAGAADADAVFSAEFDIVDSDQFRVRLRDSNGLESPSGPSFRINVQADKPPEVVMTAPARLIEATPTAVIRIEGLVSDDVDVATASLFVEAPEQRLTKVHDLVPGDRIGGCRRKERVDFAWHLDSLNLAPGDVVRYFLEARDGFYEQDRPRPAVRTSPATINIVSPQRYAERLWADLTPIHESLRRLSTRLSAAGRRTEALDSGPAAGLALSDSQRQELKRLALELRQLMAVGRTAASGMEDIVRRARDNRVEETTAAQRARRLRRDLSTDVLALIGEAAEHVERAASVEEPTDSQRAAAQHESLRTANSSQAELIETLRRMVREIDQWNELEEFARRLRGVLAKQEALTREVKALHDAAASALARAGGMSASQADMVNEQGAQGRSKPRTIQPADLFSRAEAQAALSGALADLVDSMEAWINQRSARSKIGRGGRPDRRENEDLFDVQAMRASLQAARRLSVAERMEHAAGSIDSGALEVALGSQGAAEEGLRAMLAELQERPERRLAELSRELKDLAERIGRLIRAQSALMERTRLVGGDAAGRGPTGADAAELFEELADRQESLERTTRRVEDSTRRMGRLSAAGLENAPEVQVELQAAAERMSNAAGLLAAMNSVDAGPHQRAALAGLEAALAALNEFESQVARELAERSLEAIVEMLRDVRRQQQSLRTDTAEVHARADTDGNLSRTDALRVVRLGKAQDELAGPLDAVREKIGPSVVYQHQCGRVMEQMRIAVGRLRAKDAGGAVPIQDAVIRGLTRLIEAADEQLRRNEPQFVQESSSSGGGGAASPTASRPIPPLAELKVLKAMQDDVLEQTRGLDAQLSDESRRTDSTRQEIAALGAAQQDIRDLARQLIEQAEDSKQGAE